MNNTGENAGLISSLNAWAPLVDQGLEVPAAGEVMRNAATALAAADARIAELEADKLHWVKEAQRLLKHGQDCVDNLETAETLLEEARMALAPFIRLADNVFSDGKNATVADEVTLWCFNDTDITFGDLRRVRATNVEGKEPTLLEEARMALEPFAEACTISTYPDDKDIDDSLAALRITFGDLRRARATLDRIGK